MNAQIHDAEINAISLCPTGGRDSSANRIEERAKQGGEQYALQRRCSGVSAALTLQPTLPSLSLSLFPS